MAAQTFRRSSRSVLTPRDSDRFPGESLFARVGRAVCAAESLPRKELYESWEVARRVRRRMRGGPVVELAAGHGLVSMLLLLLDDTSPTALVADPRVPATFDATYAALSDTWPRLAGRVTAVRAPLEAAPVARGDLVVAVHACGSLTDHILARAVAASARVAVLPCCRDHRDLDRGGLGGWLEGGLAVDVVRAGKLTAAGYAVHTERIPEDITPENRLLLGAPPPDAAARA